MGVQAWVESASLDDVRRWLTGSEAWLDDQTSHCQLHLDRDWDALHYLFTGSARPGRGPLSFLARGGQAVEGGANERLFRPAAVRRIDAALSALSLRVCRQRFHPLAMVDRDVYLGSWDVDAGRTVRAPQGVEGVRPTCEQGRPLPGGRQHRLTTAVRRLAKEGTVVQSVPREPQFARV